MIGFLTFFLNSALVFGISSWQGPGGNNADEDKVMLFKGLVSVKVKLEVHFPVRFFSV